MFVYMMFKMCIRFVLFIGNLFKIIDIIVNFVSIDCWKMLRGNMFLIKKKKILKFLIKINI